MVFKFQNQQKIKIKVISGLCLTAMSLALMAPGVGIVVSADSLLNSVNKSVYIETDTQGVVDIMDSSETIRLTDNTKSSLPTEVEDAELIETDRYYIVSGSITPTTLNTNISSNEKVPIRYYFDKKSKKFVKATSNVSNTLNTSVKKDVVEEVANSNNLSVDKVNKNIDVNTNTTITVYGEKPKETSRELTEQLESVKKVAIEKDILTCKVDNKDVTLGTSVYTSKKKKLDKNKLNKVTENEITYSVRNINGEYIIEGISFNINKCDYNGCKTIEDLTELLGDKPLMIGTKAFWEIVNDSNTLDVTLNKDTLELYYHQSLTSVVES